MSGRNLVDAAAVDLDAMERFAFARIEETHPDNQALYSLLYECIWPYVSANPGEDTLSRNANKALTLLIAQWMDHPDYKAEWRP